MEKDKKKPSFYYLLFSLFFIFSGINGIVDKEISMGKGGLAYIHEIGESAVHSGIIFICIGVYFGFLYFKKRKKTDCRQ